MATCEMRRESLIRTESSEVHDATDADRSRRVPHVRCPTAVGISEVGRATHGMH
jgi:hypothetical protein